MSPEPVGAGHGALLDHRGHRYQREDLGGQEGRLQIRAEGPAEDLLAAPETIDLGGVEQGDAELEGPADDGAGALLGIWLAVSPFPGAELPGAQPDLGNPGGRVDVEIAHDFILIPGRCTMRAGAHGRDSGA